MAGEREVRIQAGFALAKALGEPQVRAIFDSNGYVDEQQVVVVLESDTVQEVFARLQRYEPPVVVAIYWPETGRLEFTHLEPSTAPADYSVNRDDVGGTSTVGMLWEHTDRQANAQFRFKLNWGPATVTFARFEAVPA